MLLTNFLLLAYPFISLAFYLYGSFLYKSVWLIPVLLILSLIFCYFYYRPRPSLSFGSNHLLIIFNLICLGFILSPLIINPSVNSSTLLSQTGVGDYYKHLYTLTAINYQGLPPVHPFFPGVNFSSYYGYYLFPAFFSMFFHLPPPAVFFLVVMFTSTLCLLFLNWFYSQFIKSPFLKFLALFILICGTGLDIIPTAIKSGYNLAYPHIETWAQIANIGLFVNNTYTALLWVPHHFLAATLLLFLAYHLLYQKPKILIIITLTSFIALSSAFIAFCMAWWLSLIFWYKKSVRIPLIISGLFSLVLCLPYLLHITPHKNFFTFSPVKGFPYTKFNPVNIFLTLVTEYGLIPFTLIFGLFINQNYKKTFSWILILALAVPVITTWFITSEGYNDLAMRTILPVQLLIPLLFCVLVSKSSPNPKAILIMVAVVNLFISGYGAAFEYVGRYQTRRTFTPAESQLVYYIRKLPPRTTLAYLQFEDWINIIPAFGYHLLLSPLIFDSDPYLPQSAFVPQNAYAGLAKQLYSDTTSAPTLEKLISKRNDLFSQVTAHLSANSYDLLIFHQTLPNGKDIYPWSRILSALTPPSATVSGEFIIFPKPDLVNSLTRHSVYIDPQTAHTININNGQVYLPQGIQFLVHCSQDNCDGNLFYAPLAGSYQFSSANQINYLICYPVLFGTPNTNTP